MPSGRRPRSAAADPRVEQVVICTPDKDLAQCVGGKVIQFDRRAGQFRDAAGVREKYGVDPESIPDWLGLVGDSADGFPGLPGWGAKSAANVLRRYGHIEDIPHAPGQWDVPGQRGAAKLAGDAPPGVRAGAAVQADRDARNRRRRGNGRRMEMDRAHRRAPGLGRSARRPRPDPQRRAPGRRTGLRTARRAVGQSWWPSRTRGRPARTRWAAGGRAGRSGTRPASCRAATARTGPGGGTVRS